MAEEDDDEVAALLAADDDFNVDDFGVLDDDPLEFDDFGEMGDGADAWRFDDTKLDDLEDFLRQVEAAEAKPLDGEDKPASPSPPPMSNNILQLIRDVNNELAEAQREVLVLRDENQMLKDDLERQRSQSKDDEEMADLYDQAEESYKITENKIALLEESRKEYYELMLATMKCPEREKAGSGGPAKRGMLSMGAKKLECELIGGETLELSDRSQSGHCHVSKITLSYIKEVKMVENPRNSFGVTTAGGSYVMTASSESEAKSWVRAVQVSIKVAQAKKKSAEAK